MLKGTWGLLSLYIVPTMLAFEQTMRAPPLIKILQYSGSLVSVRGGTAQQKK